MSYKRTMNGKVPQVLQELHFDETPTPGSLNPVTSGGVAEAVEEVTGAAASNLAPEYSATSTYPKNSYVIHDGVLYTNPNAIGTAEAWNPAHWTQTTVAEMMANAGGGGYTERTVSFSSGPYNIDVKQKEVVTVVVSGTWTGEATFSLDDDCNDAVICVQKSPNTYSIDLNDVIIKRGAQTLQPLFGVHYITDVDYDSCFGVTPYYVNSSNLHSTYIIEIKGSYAIVHTI